MPDKWDKYVVSAQTPAPVDKWAKYAQPSLPAGAAAALPEGATALPGVPAPSRNLNYVPAVDSPANLLPAAWGGIKSMVAHPLQTVSGMGQPFVASGMAPGGMYPTTAPMGLGDTGKTSQRYNLQTQGAAQEQQGQQGLYAASHPMETTGAIGGQALAGAALGKLIPGFAGAGLKTMGKGMQLASATTPALETLGSRALLSGTPGELLQSALKPGTRYGPGAGQMLESSIPDVLAADPSLQGVSGFARAADTARNAAFQPYNDLLAPYRPPQALIEGQLQPAIGPVRPGTIEGTPIANAQNASIPAINRFESPSPKPSAAPPPVRFSQTPYNPMRESAPTPRTLPGMPSPSEPTGIVASTAAKADLYRKPISVAEADANIRDANAKLEAFYNKAGGDRNAALSNPETARIKSIGDETRAQLYPMLESENSLPEGTVAGMTEKYGRLVDVSDIANKREPVFARHDPVSLSQQIVMGHGGPITRAVNWGTSRLFRGLTDSDAQVNAAISRKLNPDSIPLPARPGLFPQMGSAVGGSLYGAGQTLGRTLPVKYNPFAIYAAANPPRR